LLVGDVVVIVVFEIVCIIYRALWSNGSVVGVSWNSVLVVVVLVSFRIIVRLWRRVLGSNSFGVGVLWSGRRWSLNDRRGLHGN
jgi:hypothetical protein